MPKPTFNCSAFSGKVATEFKFDLNLPQSSRCHNWNFYQNRITTKWCKWVFKHSVQQNEHTFLQYLQKNWLFRTFPFSDFYENICTSTTKVNPGPHKISGKSMHPIGRYHASKFVALIMAHTVPPLTDFEGSQSICFRDPALTFVGQTLDA